MRGGRAAALVLALGALAVVLAFCLHVRARWREAREQAHANVVAAEVRMQDLPGRMRSLVGEYGGPASGERQRQAVLDEVAAIKQASARCEADLAAAFQAEHDAKSWRWPLRYLTGRARPEAATSTAAASAGAR